MKNISSISTDEVGSKVHDDMKCAPGINYSHG